MKLVKVFIKGGLLAPDDLNMIIKNAYKIGAENFWFSDRQELAFKIDDEDVHLVHQHFQKFHYAINEGKHFAKKNITSSIVANELQETTHWLKDSIYHEILDQFHEPLSIRVNITDLKQDFVYSFTGELNFVAAEEPNYWHAYIKTKQSETQQLIPFLFHSEDLQKASLIVEELYDFGNIDLGTLSEILFSRLGSRIQQSSLGPNVRVSEFYNFEGLHKYKEKTYWLGLYRREYFFTFLQLEAICRLAKQSRTGFIYVTPWKSLVIKNIHADFLTDWKYLLAEHSINNGHAQHELNWQLYALDEAALQLKAFLRKELIKNDSAAPAVILGINNSDKYCFTHIEIKIKYAISLGNFKLFPSYDILYRKDFNPINRTFITHEQSIKKQDLFKTLSALIKVYYKKCYKEFSTFNAIAELPKVSESTTTENQQFNVYQCNTCFSVYDEMKGDPLQGIEPQTLFSSLPETFCCNICEEHKLSLIHI